MLSSAFSRVMGRPGSIVTIIKIPRVYGNGNFNFLESKGPFLLSSFLFYYEEQREPEVLAQSSPILDSFIAGERINVNKGKYRCPRIMLQDPI